MRMLHEHDDRMGCQVGQSLRRNLLQPRGFCRSVSVILGESIRLMLVPAGNRVRDYIQNTVHRRKEKRENSQVNPEGWFNTPGGRRNICIIDDQGEHPESDERSNQRGNDVFHKVPFLVMAYFVGKNPDNFIRRVAPGYKKAGVVITKLVQEEGHTRSLFEDTTAAEKEARLSSAIDSIQRSCGRSSLMLAVQGDGQIKMNREHQSPHYTTLWEDIPGVKVG